MKKRLDQLLSENGYSKSREKAKKEIIAGWVKVNGETIRDPSKKISEESEIRVERPGGDFVSRGGEKLNHALSHFNIDLKGKIVADLGASTGGFTHCSLLRGAQKVYSIDVGYGQLDYSLRTDSRVVVMERTNVRNLEPGDIEDHIDFISADLSFISLTKVFDKIKELFSPVEGVVLLKPQFEAESGEHKKGVVRKSEDHVNILKRVVHALVEKGMNFRGLTFSPIKGPAGNIEFLLFFDVDETDVVADDSSSANLTSETRNITSDTLAVDSVIDKIVEESHLKLNG